MSSIICCLWSVIRQLPYIYRADYKWRALAKLPIPPSRDLIYSMTLLCAANTKIEGILWWRNAVSFFRVDDVVFAIALHSLTTLITM